ncbi:MAG: group 1 glycosyl transferase [Desulfobacterium sp.]|nr:group 1 glycosyl transferase [Desulfobacterium sp.]
MKAIAIVIPWFGKDLKGGAEQEAFQVATRLAARGRKVEVLTTCCRSFADDWGKNYYKQGEEQINGVCVRRFPVDKRDQDSFDRVNRILLDLKKSDLIPGVYPIAKPLSDTFAHENINSASLLKYLEMKQEQYEAFIFMPYLYGIILNGLPIVSEKAYLQPCLHDEAYAYLPEVERLFFLAKGVLFLSVGEMILAQKLYGPGFCRMGTVIGGGVEVNSGKQNSVAKIGSFNLEQSKFILCLGRRDQTKNTDLLVSAFEEFRTNHVDSDLLLVLAGPGPNNYHDESKGIIDLQLVSDDEKEMLLSSCIALFQPSKNESFSRVIMEAWFHLKPVVANRECLATATAVRQSGGGLLADSKTEWADRFSEFENMDIMKMEEFCRKGLHYAKENVSWEKVIDRYEMLWNTEKLIFFTTRKSSCKLKEIHQLLPNLTYGDAISNHAIEIRNFLRDSGYQSNIYVRYLDDKMATEAVVFQSKIIGKRAGIIYHHSIGSELTSFAVKHSGPKLMIYHNITPAHFFEPYDPEYARILTKGRLDLQLLSDVFHISAGDSKFNSDELRQTGFPNPSVLPICVNPDKWKTPADSKLMARLQDGIANILFVGRIAPNKCQDHLVESFHHYLTMDPDARLIMVGFGQPADPYYQHLKKIISKFGLMRKVFLVGQVTESELQAYYRTAHLFWSMSEHEGFCIPLIESMWFDIPVLSFKSTAVPETLGDAGILFNSKDDLIHVAALAKLMVRDDKIRDLVLNAQRQRRNAFLPEAVWPQLDRLIQKMEEQAA